MPILKPLVALAFVVSGLCLLRPTGGPFHNDTPSANVRSAITAQITNLHHKPSALYCSCNGIDGRDLIFDLLVRNRRTETQNVYAFVWATNDAVSPPERGLWPVAAVDTCLTDTGQLRITDCTAGRRITVPGRGTVTVQGNAILEPLGWLDGKPVSFRTLRVELWSVTDGRVFQQTVDLLGPGRPGADSREPLTGASLPHD